MSDFSRQYAGGCNCGAVSLIYHCNQAADELEPRACQCLFCRPRAASYLGGSDSRLEVRVSDRRYLYAHVFGTGTADFVHCGRCNTLVYVTSIVDDREYALVAAQALDLQVDPGRSRPMDFEGESLAERLARRANTWIPELEVAEHD